MQLAKYRLRGSLQNNLSSFFIKNGGEEREREGERRKGGKRGKRGSNACLREENL